MPDALACIRFGVDDVTRSDALQDARACSFDTDFAQMSLMPASSRFPAVITDASTLSPMATTAVSKSDALSCSTASTSVMSA